MSKIKYIFSSAFLFSLAMSAGAAPLSTNPTTITTLDQQGILDLIGKITNWFASFIALLAVIGLLYAAFLYVTQEEKRDDAKSMIWYSIIGVIVAIVAFSIVPLVNSFLSL